MGSEPQTGEMLALPEDTIDLGERLDPVRTLLRRSAGGDQQAAAALVDVLAPRIHGLAVHVTGSSARAEKLTVGVLRACLRDAASLGASGLPGEAAVLDRARRVVVATRPTGDVRSLASSAADADRTTDRRELDVLRVLLDLPSGQRALVESAAQGRFALTGAPRQQAATVLAGVLDSLCRFGPPTDPELRGLSALDALALADEEERERLRELTRAPDTAGIHRRAIEAAARLAVLTAVPPSRDLRGAVLEGFHGSLAPSPVAAPDPERPREGGPGRAPEPETAYSGTYSTPVLGTDTQRRVVGPPAVAGGVHSSSADAAPHGAPLPSGIASMPQARTSIAQSPGGDVPGPAFAFRPGDEKHRSRRGRRRERTLARAGARSVHWISRTVAAISLIAALVLGALLWDSHRRLDQAEAFSAEWSALSMAPGAQLVSGISDNGRWQAVLAEEGVVLRAEGVESIDGEVLELWAESDGTARSLGVLEPTSEGAIRFTSPQSGQRLFVTREIEPGSQSGSPSTRVVASLDPTT